MRSQNRNMIRGGFCIRWPHANIDQCNAIPIGPFKMIRRHLRRFGQIRQYAIGCGDLMIARRDKACVAGIGIRQGGARNLFELINIKLIIRKEDEILKMIRPRRCIMAQPR